MCRILHNTKITMEYFWQFLLIFLGKIDNLAGYYQAIGFSGHGLMLAPRTAVLMANCITDPDFQDEDLSRLNLNRFKHGVISGERSVV